MSNSDTKGDVLNNTSLSETKGLTSLSETKGLTSLRPIISNQPITGNNKSHKRATTSTPQAVIKPVIKPVVALNNSSSHPFPINGTVSKIVEVQDIPSVSATTSFTKIATSSLSPVATSTLVNSNLSQTYNGTPHNPDIILNLSTAIQPVVTQSESVNYPSPVNLSLVPGGTQRVVNLIDDNYQFIITFSHGSILRNLTTYLSGLHGNLAATGSCYFEIGPEGLRYYGVSTGHNIFNCCYIPRENMVNFLISDQIPRAFVIDIPQMKKTLASIEAKEAVSLRKKNNDDRIYIVSRVSKFSEILRGGGNTIFINPVKTDIPILNIPQFKPVSSYPNSVMSSTELAAFCKQVTKDSKVAILSEDNSIGMMIEDKEGHTGGMCQAETNQTEMHRTPSDNRIVGVMDGKMFENLKHMKTLSGDALVKFHNNFNHTSQVLRLTVPISYVGILTCYLKLATKAGS